MSRADNDCAMTEQDAVAEDELKRYSQQLVHKAQFRYARTFKVGSSAEISCNHLGMQRLGVRRDNEDVDYMFYPINRYPFPFTQRVPVEYNGVVLRVYTHGVHPGYARPIEETSGKEEKHLHHSHLGRYDKICGPAERYRSSDDMRENPEHVYDESDITLNSFAPIVDNVLSIHSPYWPVEASEWITRTRCHACPSKSVIKQVVRYGCDFVGVAHKLSCNRENENKWRFSFSIAELIVIRNWTRSQKIAYRMLRLTYKLIAQNAAKRNIETSLCTYYFKTLMLWACEKRPEEFWAEYLLANLMQQLLMEMAEWLKLKLCCNYFKRENNIMDHLVDIDVSHDVADLYEASASRELVAYVTTLCAANELYASALTLCSDLPTWIHRTNLIYDRVFRVRDNYRDLASNEISFELQTTLIQEMTDVYCGLAYHKQAVIRDAVRNKCLHRAEEHFTAATRLHQCTERTIVDISKSVYNLICNFFTAYDADNKVSSIWAAKSVTEQRALQCEYNKAFFSKSAKYRRLLYNRVIVQQNKDLTPAMLLVVYMSNVNESLNDVDVHFYRQRLSHNPTVNMSWFLSKAYLANLYYTQRHYKAARETCDEVVEVFKHSTANERFSQLIFRVLLSTQWAAVYDAELQALLGLCSLCAFVSNRTDALCVPRCVSSPIRSLSEGALCNG